MQNTLRLHFFALCLVIFATLSGANLAQASESLGASDSAACKQEMTSVNYVGALNDVATLRCNLEGQRCQTRYDCCKGVCRGGVCRASGAGLCKGIGRICISDRDCCSRNCVVGRCQR